MKNIHSTVFKYKKLGFTKFIEENETSWTLKILSNVDSELVYESEFKHLWQLDYLYNDVTLALDKYITINRGEHEAIGEFLKGWKIDG